MGHGEVTDLMIHDGLWDAYGGLHMGNAAELCARTHGVSRAEQDGYARASYDRALLAQRSGAFAAEIAAVKVETRAGSKLVQEDEEPGRANLDKLESLKPAFDPEGTVTAANASKISDGAAALVLASEAALRTHGLTPVARILASSSHAQAPEWFTTAPAYAIDKLLGRLALSPNDIDLYEVNEAFAVVCLACNALAKLPAERVNVHGGAVALGHPIGASGARVLVTLVHALRARNGKRGVASLCIGGGEALALAVALV
jgi:acetyl-CoA C-acetyltransferase